jgi:hypothetical protein
MRGVWKSDFSAIAKAIQAQNRREFSADADRPDCKPDGQSS